MRKNMESRLKRIEEQLSELADAVAFLLSEVEEEEQPVFAPVMHQPAIRHKDLKKLLSGEEGENT